MEFREFLTMISRRLWLIIALPILAAASSLIFHSSSTPLWQGTLRFTISFAPPPGEVTAEDLYNLALASEYLADDFSVVVRSEAFAQDVSDRLGEQGIEVSPGALQGYTVAQKEHRVLTVLISWPKQEEIEPIARAVKIALEEDAAKYIYQIAATGARIYLIDGPGLPGWAPVDLGEPLGQRLDLPIRTGLGLLASIGLALALHYFDDRLYTAQELEAVGLRVVGTLPRHKSRF